jgi:hypothetical protein
MSKINRRGEMGDEAEKRELRTVTKQEEIQRRELASQYRLEASP